MLAAYTFLQNRYRIVSQLGRGGMGTIYQAIDERLNTIVAVKETTAESERLRRAFKRQASLLANLHHPALPAVKDHFNEGNRQYIVMQFIPGNDLAEAMNRRGGPFLPNKVLAWADELLDALDYLHTTDAHNNFMPGDHWNQ